MPDITLAEAISQVESSVTVYGAAVSQTQADTAIADGIAAKLVAAQSVVAEDKGKQAEAAVAFNGALDALIAAATAAKIVV